MPFFWGDKNKKLLEAARKGHTKTVQTLLKKGADVNIKNEEGRTALMFATKNGRTEIAKLLKLAGATK